MHPPRRFQRDAYWFWERHRTGRVQIDDDRTWQLRHVTASDPGSLMRRRADLLNRDHSTQRVERFGKDTLFWDHGTSPVLTDKHVVVARMHHGDSWLAAFDKTSGEPAWKIARNYSTPTEGDRGYATPPVIQHAGKEALLVWGAQHLTIHDAADGNVLWLCGNFNPEANAL
jgi:hypothetical protein